MLSAEKAGRYVLALALGFDLKRPIKSLYPRVLDQSESFYFINDDPNVIFNRRGMIRALRVRFQFNINDGTDRFQVFPPFREVAEQ